MCQERVFQTPWNTEQNVYFVDSLSLLVIRGKSEDGTYFLSVFYQYQEVLR